MAAIFKRIDKAGTYFHVKQTNSGFKVFKRGISTTLKKCEMTPEELTKSLKTEAKKLGFELAGACPAVAPTGFNHFEDWLAAGFHGEMDYLPARREAYRNPDHILDGVASILMLGLNYHSAAPNEAKPGFGYVSRYAWGDGDYHDLVHNKLKALTRFCQTLPIEMRARGIVDTAPLLEREFGQLAGIGWHAKNTMLINKQIGSWFFLAALLVDRELEYEKPHETSHCGTCTACLDACPTGAFVRPHVLDATKCVSYLTIEHRSQIPEELRTGIGRWVFGCDICQVVCPWNNKAFETEEQSFAPEPDRNPMNLRSIFDLSDAQFRDLFRKTPLWRAKRRGLVRNAAIALGNAPSDENVAALTRGLGDSEELIRGASAWALGRHAMQLAQPPLRARLEVEKIESVKSEIQAALEFLVAISRDG